LISASDGLTQTTRTYDRNEKIQVNFFIATLLAFVDNSIRLRFLNNRNANARI
jgi:hypothetical protein